MKFDIQTKEVEKLGEGGKFIKEEKRAGRFRKGFADLGTWLPNICLSITL